MKTLRLLDGDMEFLGREAEALADHYDDMVKAWGNFATEDAQAHLERWRKGAATMRAIQVAIREQTGC